ncbi:MAG TPA: ammonia channel protein [Rhodospirillaceae bacterium]|nr:ammonia channel protein [Rhodospirillaceae bacterium]HAA93615.1 ammonia channel protein [Rhodospirillaceae bacterium]HAT36774.1 ammonia channel protein [Rhodospirillaceae bacterium]
MKFISTLMRPLALAALFTGGLTMPAWAADKLNSGDTAWMLTSTALVLLMTIPGVALFYGGMVRKKGVLAVTMQSFATTCLITLVWFAVGYSLAFGAGNDYVGDLSAAFFAGITKDALSGTFPTSVFAIFQLTFAIITAALITGAVADRMKFGPLLIFLALWSILVYSPVTHWVWGGGFLSKDGVLDFAGGTVVHINCGIAGLVACLVLGKRTGFGTENMAPHNLTLSIIGASLLWVGWFGFNAGSAVAADGAAGMAMAVTQIATATAALAWMICEWITLGKPSVLGIVSGAVAGLVAITPASGFVDPMGSFWIGLASGVICWWTSTKLKYILGYDDSLDVFGIHGVGGIVGAILTGVFAVEAIGGTKGALEGNIGQIWIQFEGILATIVWCAVITFVLLKILDVTMGIRVSEEEEREGLDTHLHGESVQ